MATEPVVVAAAAPAAVATGERTRIGEREHELEVNEEDVQETTVPPLLQLRGRGRSSTRSMEESSYARRSRDREHAPSPRLKRRNALRFTAHELRSLR
mmetsp:Transcript_10907/g.23298  ORF Transcript_10907/g.23298 Transcript_10907/m.23298 type:complete len:98 (-) Transcript_10907:1449-1742(-)